MASSASEGSVTSLIGPAGAPGPTGTPGPIGVLGTSAADSAPPLLSEHVVYILGVLQGADGVTTTPPVLLRPQYISRSP